MQQAADNTKVLLGARRLGRIALFRLLVFSLLATGLGFELTAAEITTYVDKAGHCVYVNSEDHELRAAIKKDGIAGASRVIEERKRALPAIEEYIGRVSSEFQVDSKLVLAMIEVESGWNTKARSSKGALGLMQLMPDTAARFRVGDPFDPKKNIEGGVRYMRFLLDRFSQDLTIALAAYNAGETVVEKRGGVPPYEETRDYVSRVRKRFAELQGGILPNSTGVVRTIEGGRIVYTNTL